MALPGSAASLPPPVRIPEFEGPLDLLLDEVRRQNVAIENIAMAPIVARFLEYVRAAAECNLNPDIEWLHMAATLIHWKSRSLLPPDIGDDSRKDPIRDELIQQLVAHRKQAANELARRRAVEETHFARAGSQVETAPPDPPGEPQLVSVWDLIQQARDLARWAERHRTDRRLWRESFGVEQDEFKVEDMIRHWRSCLKTHGGRLEASGLLGEEPPANRPLLFLALLELAREDGIQVEQKESFGPIWLASDKADGLLS